MRLSRFSFISKWPNDVSRNIIDLNGSFFNETN